MLNLARSLVLSLCLVAVCRAQSDLTQLNLQDLGKIEVTSASRKSESLAAAPAAIYVLTAEAIRQGGFRNLPDALRMVPGLYVAQTDAHIWQISARGFSDLNNNKMLVLVDGRSVYTPLYGGVYWDTLDIPLENIDRVEIIRGPGGTLWGANAVNGVINIVTKEAANAEGTLVSASVDKDEGYTTTVRYGGNIGTNAGYYVYGRTTYWEPYKSPTGARGANRMLLPQAGLRLDWNVGAKDSLSLEGGAYDGRMSSIDYISPIPVNALIKGNNALARWKHTFSSRSSSETTFYCDWYSRYGFPGESRNTCDLEVQHDYEINGRNSIIWGGTFNTTGDEVSQEGPWIPRLRRRSDVESGFVQYGFTVIPDRLRLVGGSKIEHNGYTGGEYQPQIRAVWTPLKSHSIWTSCSRAIRVPSRGESDLNLHLYIPNAGPGGMPVLFDVRGNTNLESERLRAYEVGYRFESKSFTADLATYYNDFANRLIQQQTISLSQAGLVMDYHYVNKGTAQSHGAELAAQWRPFSRWALSGAVTETRGSPDALEASPKHLFNIQSHFIATSRLTVETAMYRYSAVPLGRLVDYPTVPLQSVSSFDRLDFGGDWHLRPEWSIGVWGRNLQSPRHLETRNTIFGNFAGEVPRSVEFRLMWQHGEGSGKK